MKRKIYKINHNKLIVDSNLSFLGRSNIDGHSIYYVDFYSEANVKVRKLQKGIAVNKYNSSDKGYNETRDLERLIEISTPSSFDDIINYLNDKFKLKLSENDVIEVHSIIEHLPFLDD